MRTPTPVFSCKTAFLSDFHLGSGKTAVSYLYEFLSHLDFDTLEDVHLVGDIVGGWEQVSRKQRAFPEMERRVLDILNYAAARGINIHVYPGNHDEKLRGIKTSRGKRVDVIDLLNRGAHRARNPRRRVPYTFAPGVNFAYEGEINLNGKRLKIAHGDLNDPDVYQKWWFKPVVETTSWAYDRLIDFDAWASRNCYRYLGVEIAFAKKLKSWFKSHIERAVSRESVLQDLEHDGFDGVIVGHTHMPGIQTFERHGKTYTIYNDGDWQEGGSAAMIRGQGGDIEILDYRGERDKLFTTPLPNEQSVHPARFAEYRTQTDRQIRLIRRMWPVKESSRKKQLRYYAHAARKLREHRQDIVALEHALDALGTYSAAKFEAACAPIISVGLRKKRFSLQAQRIQGIFKRSVDGSLNETDRKYLVQAASELRERGLAKLKEHFREQCRAARNLDYSEPSPPSLLVREPRAALQVA